MNKIKEELKGGASLLALSWRQPYATLMLHGKIETRHWATLKVGSLVLICCSKKSYPWDVVNNISGENQFLRILSIIQGERCAIGTPMNGYAIAIGRLVECRKMNPADENKTFVKYHAGLLCHVYESVTRIVPFPFKGKQGWTKVSKEIIDQIQFYE